MEEYINIGKVSVDKIKKYIKGVSTDEVILTEERIEHIKERHEEQYYEIRPFLKEIIEDPDYILKEMKHEDTIILLKEIIQNEFRVKVIIKLAIKEVKEMKNSIITFWKIRERDYRKTIDKCEIIYKKARQ